MDGGFCSAVFSGGGGACSSSIFGALFCVSRFGAEFPEEGGRAGLLLDRDRRCGLDDVAGDCLSAIDLSLRADDTDFVRER